MGGDLALFFGARGRLERWIRVERAFIRFMLLREGRSKPDIEAVMAMCRVSPFEVMRDVENPDEGFDFFKGVFASKSSALRGAHYEYGLDYEGLSSVADSLMIRDWNWMLFRRLRSLKEGLRELAFRHRRLVQIGRTHGVHAEPTSFGYRFAVMYSDVVRYVDSVFGNRRHVETVSFGYRNLLDPSMGDDLKVFLADELDLFVGEGSQLGPRLNFLGILNGLVQTIAKHTLDLMLLGSREVGEICVTEEVYGLMSRMEMMAKRVDSNLRLYGDLTSGVGCGRPEFSAAGSALLREMLRGVTEMVDGFALIVAGVEPDAVAIERNLAQADESIYSQKILLHLVRTTDHSREQISESLKRMTAGVRIGEADRSFKAILSGSEYRHVLPEETVEELFDKDSFLENIDEVYARIFGSEEKYRSLKKILWDQNEIDYAIDRLANRLNREYADTKVPVTAIAFAERALVFAGALLSRLTFPVSFRCLPHTREDLEIRRIHFDPSLIRSKRVLIVDFLVHPDSNLDHFIEKLTELGTPFDCRICSLLKFNNVTDERFVVSWSGFECEPDDFYAGFGKNCGSSDFFRHFPVIGLAA